MKLNKKNIFLVMAALLILVAWAWQALCLSGEFQVHRESLGRGVGMEFMMEVQDDAKYIIPEHLKVALPSNSEFYGFKLFIRSGYHPNINHGNEVIGYYIQTKEVPWWLFSGDKIMALELKEDLCVNVVGIVSAIMEIKKWNNSTGRTSR